MVSAAPSPAVKNQKARRAHFTPERTQEPSFTAYWTASTSA